LIETEGIINGIFAGKNRSDKLMVYGVFLSHGQIIFTRSASAMRTKDKGDKSMGYIQPRTDRTN
jgi:hypothetical protein